MALWQFDLYLVQASVVSRRYAVLPAIMPFEEADRQELFAIDGDAGTITDQFDKLLTRTASWNAGTQMWGQEDSDRIDLSINEGKIESIFVRIDLRRLDYTFVSNLVRCAEKNNWLIFACMGCLLPPRMTRLLRAIQKSDNFRFVEDPKGFLSHLTQLTSED